MRWLTLATMLVCGALPRAAEARDYIWYDAAQQAIAIDLYAYDFGNFVELDFNADHSTAGAVDQRFGDVTFLGLRRVTIYDDYTAHFFGWSDELLVDAEPAAGFSTTVTKLGDDTPAADCFHYFTPEWDTQAGKAVIYVRPATATGSSVPVTPDMLANTFVRLNEVEWQPLQSVPLLLAPLAAEVSVSPGVFHKTHDKGSLLAKITLPSPYTVDDLDLSTVSLSISSTVAVEDVQWLAQKLTKKVAQAGKGGKTLIAQFERQELQSMLWAPSATIYAIGRLHDGTPIRGSTVVTVTE